MLRTLLMAALCCCALISNAQLQWACEVEDCSQTYSSGDIDYKPAAALGEPNVWDTRPRASANSYLFGWDEKPDNEARGDVFIKVKFCTPQKANRAAVVENANPGTITAIYLYDASGKEYSVWTGSIKNTTAPRRLLEAVFPTTSYDVVAMKVVGRPFSVKGWNALDGFAIANSVEPIDLPIEVENLGPKINTKFSDSSPRISPDGRTLYFIREGHPNNMGSFAKDDDQDIWFSEMDRHGEWQEAENMGKPLNNKGYNWLLNMTPDGRKLFVAGTYTEYGEPAGQGVSVATREGGKLQMPQKVNIIDFENKNDFADYYISSDERILLMAVEASDSRGDLDLYVAKRLGDGKYGRPKNLGKTLNTRKTEGAPFLAPDGVTLYFSSDGLQGGQGDSDIWMTKRLDNTWQNWSEPKNLGSPINSSDYDSDFSISAQGDYAYLVRYDDTYGEGDVFRIPLEESLRPNPVALIRGRVLNAETKEPIGADILYELLPEGTEIGSARSKDGTGAYQIILPYGKNYGFMGRANGFYPVTENLDLSNLTAYEEIERDLFLAPVTVGQTIRLNNIFFEFGKAILKAESYPELQRVADLLEGNSSIKIELSGHTDNVGSDGANQQLSKERAQSCVDYLSSLGLDGARVVVKGYGEAQPVATNDSDEGRALNRRVEFKVLEK